MIVFDTKIKNSKVKISSLELKLNNHLFLPNFQVFNALKV